MNRVVSFTVTERQRREMDTYAQEKGFRTASDLARYATFQHMRRYRGRKGEKDSQAVQPNEPEGLENDTRDNP